jgi:hypothetical protein
MGAPGGAPIAFCIPSHLTPVTQGMGHKPVGIC